MGQASPSLGCRRAGLGAKASSPGQKGHLPRQQWQLLSSPEQGRTDALPTHEDRPSGGGAVWVAVCPYWSSGFTGTSVGPSVPHGGQLSCPPSPADQADRAHRHISPRWCPQAPLWGLHRGPGTLVLPPQWLPEGAGFSFPHWLCVGLTSSLSSLLPQPGPR